MIFYKLPNITKKLQRLCRRLKSLIKLAAFKARYVIQVLEIEEKIAHLEQVLQNSSISNGVKPEKENSQKKTSMIQEHQNYLISLEPTLVKALKRRDIKVILSEIIDDCLLVLTDKGVIQRNLNGWLVDFRDGRKAIIKFMDLAIESLMLGKEAC